MRLSGSLAALAAVAVALLAGCSGGGQTPDAGQGGSTGAGGIGMPPDPNVDPMDLLSDFEQGRALVLPLGSPMRNGAWYAYNDGSCLQSPAHGEGYYDSTPIAPAPGLSHGRALHINWNQCTGWGAGAGADFGSPASDGGVVPARPRMPYDLTPYVGVAFWAMASPGAETSIRLKLVMRASTQIIDGGACDESILGVDRCGDEWGLPFSLPADGTWKAVSMRFSDPAFKPEGWGNMFAWNPADVLGIQFQSVRTAVPDPSKLYDFWIDDIYLVR